MDIALHDDEIDILVTPLNDLVLEGGRGVLRMSVSCKEFIGRFQTVQVEIGEATGRAVVCAWDECPYQTKVFIGDLV